MVTVNRFFPLRLKIETKSFDFFGKFYYKLFWKKSDLNFMFLKISTFGFHFLIALKWELGTS